MILVKHVLKLNVHDVDFRFVKIVMRSLVMNFIGLDITINVHKRVWLEWQTRPTQNRMVEIPCRFDSYYPHQFIPA